MDSVSSIGVLDKAVRLLRALEEAGPSGLGELQSTTGLPRATLHRIAVALEAHGLLGRDASGRFCLGLGLVALGASAAGSFPIAGLARPRLQQLCDDTGESVQLYVREGDRRRCAVSLPSPHGLRWIVPEGSRLSLDVGSAGHVLSGRASADDWVESIEERETGVASVSAAVRSPAGRVLAAVSVGGPLARMAPSPGGRFGAAVVTAARDIERALQPVH